MHGENKNKIYCDLILGSAIKVLADFKIDDLSENEVVLRCKKYKLKIYGSCLKIVTLAKGEIEIVGNVDGVIIFLKPK